MLFTVLRVLETGSSHSCLLWLLPHLLLCKCLCRHIGAGVETGLVLMNSWKRPLCLGHCHVLDSVLSSTVQTLVPVQKQRDVQVALFSGGLSLTGLRFLCLSPCLSKVYANRPFPEYIRFWELRTNSYFPPFP